LRRRGINEGLVGIIRSYLYEREVILEAEGKSKIKKISSGVPQGSVLGPTLWNVMYDDLLEIEQPQGVELVGFADDVAMVVVAKTERALMDTADTALLRVANWLNDKQLQLAPEKTEAILLTTKRKIQPIAFNVRGTIIGLSKAIKYLGVWLDTKLTFAEHVNQIVQKAGKTTTALMSLMPNIGGPRASRRKLLASVVHSQILYAAPVWHRIIENKKLISRLNSIQRVLCIRVCSGYRTVSLAATGVIAGIPPIGLMVLERKETFQGVPPKDARISLLTRWQAEWETGKFGRWTFTLIPNIQTWLERPYGEVDYFISQAISGHGCFRKYLYERNRADSSDCPYCGKLDDVEHTLFFCSRWEAERLEFLETSQTHFNAANMMANLLTSRETWEKAYKTIRNIIEIKEREAR